jgi:hypothetical protein
MLIGSRLSVEKGIIAQGLLDRDWNAWSQDKAVPFVELSVERRNLCLFLLVHFLRFASQGFHIKIMFVLVVGGCEFPNSAGHTLAPCPATDWPDIRALGDDLAGNAG